MYVVSGSRKNSVCGCTGITVLLMMVSPVLLLKHRTEQLLIAPLVTSGSLHRTVMDSELSALTWTPVGGPGGSGNGRQELHLCHGIQTILHNSYGLTNKKDRTGLHIDSKREEGIILYLHIVQNPQSRLKSWYSVTDCTANIEAQTAIITLPQAVLVIQEFTGKSSFLCSTT